MEFPSEFSMYIYLKKKCVFGNEFRKKVKNFGKK